MVFIEKEFIYHEETNDILGAIVRDNTSWQAQTVFGYPIARTATRVEAEKLVRDEGASSLRGTWQYYDVDEHDWFTCKINEAHENKVVITRTDESGMPDPKLYKLVVLMNPTEEMLMKLS